MFNLTSQLDLIHECTYSCSIHHIQKAFKHFGVAILKSSVMMLGEFEFGDLFLGNEVENPEYEDILIFPLATYLVFCAFGFIMSIVIMNTLVSLPASKY